MAEHSVTRVLIHHEGSLYRFLKIDALSDGSLLLLLDRARSPKIGAQKLVGEVLVDDEKDDGEVKDHAKITLHTTGRINYNEYGERQSVFYIDPLYKLPKTTDIALFSIPALSRLETASLNSLSPNGVTIDMPSEAIGRVTFSVGIGPASEPDSDIFGVVLRYEHYKLVIQLVPSGPLEVVGERFCTVVRSGGEGRLQQQAIKQDQAELDFYQHMAAAGPLIFRERQGTYVALTAVPMRIHPKIAVEFTRPELGFEQIGYEKTQEITHKVRFWITDRGGRNKSDDLRAYIKNIIFDSRFQITI